MIELIFQATLFAWVLVFLGSIFGPEKIRGACFVTWPAVLYWLLGTLFVGNVALGGVAYLVGGKELAVSVVKLVGLSACGLAWYHGFQTFASSYDEIENQKN